MNSAKTTKQFLLYLMVLGLSSCFHAPYNNFENDHRALKKMAVVTAAGAGVGAIAGSVAGNTLAGAAIGGVIGAATGVYRNSEAALLRDLSREDIQFVRHGDTMTLLVPTDKYYEFNSSRLNDICFPGLNNIVRLLHFYSCHPIYVAGFTDNIGSKQHKNKLSAARADAMVTFLWAKGVKAKHLHAEGYGDQFPLGENTIIHGSAFNRRIEIQWFTQPDCIEQAEMPLLLEK